MKTTTIIILLAYLVGGFATYGYVWNHSKGEDRCYVTNGVQHDCFTDNSNRAAASIFSGSAWPIYWGGIIAIKATAS